MSTPDTIGRFERQFSTYWHDLASARVWIDETLAAKLVNPPEPAERDYTLESTGCYHLRVIRALGGQPHVVNPTLAGGSRRKTDFLDSRLLAWQDLSGLWPRSYIVEPEIQALRALLLVRKKTMRAASAESARAGSMLLKFGYTFHVENGIVDRKNRVLFQRICENDPTLSENVFPPGQLPEPIKEQVNAQLNFYDDLKMRAEATMRKCMLMANDIQGPQRQAGCRALR